MAGWEDDPSQALQINHGSVKDPLTPCSAYLMQQAASACGSENERMEFRVSSPGLSYALAADFVPQSRMLNFAQ